MHRADSTISNIEKGNKEAGEDLLPEIAKALRFVSVEELTNASRQQVLEWKRVGDQKFEERRQKKPQKQARASVLETFHEREGSTPRGNAVVPALQKTEPAPPDIGTVTPVAPIVPPGATAVSGALPGPTSLDDEAELAPFERELRRIMSSYQLPYGPRRVVQQKILDYARDVLRSVQCELQHKESERP